MLTLYIANKNYSSWSMRPWVLMKQKGIEFNEVMVPIDSFDPDSEFKKQLAAVSPVAKAPVLVDGSDGEPIVIWDSMAIVEYLAERFPSLKLWPEDFRQRAEARCICAEMHSGFQALRSACIMNIDASLSEAGALIWRDNAGVRADIARIVQMWQGLLSRHGGPMLFGEFSIADAFYAPVVMRMKTYALPVPDEVKAYMQRVIVLPGVQAWIQEALAEDGFVVVDEPYRLRRWNVNSQENEQS